MAGLRGVVYISDDDAADVTQNDAVTAIQCDPDDVTHDDSDDTEQRETLKTPTHDGSVMKTPPIRSSERIRRNLQREFHMPTRHEVLDKIDHGTTPKSHVQPRKHINSLVKVHYRYNHDPDNTDDEGSMDSFLDDERSPGGTSSDSERESSISEGALSESDDENPVTFSAKKRKIIESDVSDVEKVKCTNSQEVKCTNSQVKSTKIVRALSESDDEKPVRFSAKKRKIIESDVSDVEEVKSTNSQGVNSTDSQEAKCTKSERALSESDDEKPVRFSAKKRKIIESEESDVEEVKSTDIQEVKSTNSQVVNSTNSQEAKSTNSQEVTSTNNQEKSTSDCTEITRSKRNKVAAIAMALMLDDLAAADDDFLLLMALNEHERGRRVFSELESSTESESASKSENSGESDCCEVLESSDVVTESDLEDRDAKSDTSDESDQLTSPRIRLMEKKRAAKRKLFDEFKKRREKRMKMNLL